MTTLDAVPDINMLTYLPEILDGLFQILGDQNQEIRQTYVKIRSSLYSAVFLCIGFCFNLLYINLYILFIYKQ